MLNVCCVCVYAGKSGYLSRQYFPYVSSESDLQRYRATTTGPHRQSSVQKDDHNGSSSLSNVPSDRVKVKQQIPNYSVDR